MRVPGNFAFRKLAFLASATFLFIAFASSVVPGEEVKRERLEVDPIFGRVPLHFESNQGRGAEAIKYWARGQGYGIYVADGEVLFTLNRVVGQAGQRLRPAGSARAAQSNPFSVLRMKLIGANTVAQITSEDMLPTKVHHFSGNDPAKWRTNVATFGRVRCREVYRGVDLLLYGNQQQLEYDFVVSPGANPKRIRFRIDGATRLEIDAQGDLVLHTADGHLKQRRPVAYQTINGVRKEVEARYRLAGREVRFQLGRYDQRHALVIDPVLVYSTYFGAIGDQYINTVAAGTNGSVYLAGFTTKALPQITPGAFQSNFVASPQNPWSGDTDYNGFVAKLSSPLKNCQERLNEAR